MSISQLVTTTAPTGGRRGWLKAIAAAGVSWSVPAAWAGKPEASAKNPLPLTLAKPAPEDWDPRGWLISEKLDGVRAWWDGCDLRFRSGRSIAAPTWFLSGLPDHPLDGELWMGRGTFESLVSTVRRKSPSDAAWRAVEFHVFESPESLGTFAERLAVLGDRWRRNPSSIWRVTPHRQVADRADLREWLDQVLQHGGEGLMAHRADAPFEVGRSDQLLKIKARQDDEAWVVAHLPGQGRLAGQVGALKVRNRAGVEFELGTGLSENLRLHPPAPGQLVTYRFQGLTAQGVPRFASLWRVYPDL